MQSNFKLAGGTQFAPTYFLDSSQVDVKLARALYTNTEPRYKLGAGFARPAINVPVGFMGVPEFRASEPTNDAANDWLKRLVPQWSRDIVRIHQAALLDGECLVRIRPMNRSPAYASLFSNSDRDLELTYEPVEAYEIIYKDEDIGAIEGIRVKHIFIIDDEQGNPQTRSLIETVTATNINLKYENDFRPERNLPNPLGFVPAVRFQNENFRHELKGRSELEPVEPYLKFYNDVALHAGAASKLHSTAKLVLRVQDVERFLTNNFSDAEITAGSLKFKNKDVLFFESGEPTISTSGGAAFAEGAEIIQARAPLGDTNTLLEYIFLNIVDVTEVPEWAFGGAIASSKASVSEQSAPLVHKVNRKRSIFENNWALVARMALKMLGISTRVEISWDDLAQRDTKAEAETVKLLSEALVTLNDAQLISRISAVEELRPYLRKLLPYDFDNSRKEASRIALEEQERVAGVAVELESEDTELERQDRDAGIRAIG